MLFDREIYLFVYTILKRCFQEQFLWNTVRTDTLIKKFYFIEKNNILLDLQKDVKTKINCQPIVKFSIIKNSAHDIKILFIKNFGFYLILK